MLKRPSCSHDGLCAGLPTPHCAASHSATLADPISRVRPLVICSSRNGVSSRNTTYMGRMPKNGGWKISSAACHHAGRPDQQGAAPRHLLEQERGQQQEHDVHGEDAEKRRLEDQQRAMPPPCPEIRESAGDLPAAPQTTQQNQGVKHKKSEIDVACPMPGTAPQGSLAVLDQNSSVDPGADEPRDKHKALGGGDKTETLNREMKERMLGQVVDHHHHQEETTQGVDPRVAHCGGPCVHDR